MSHQNQATAPIPVFVPAESIHWFVDASGVFRVAHGDGLARLGWTARDMEGQSVGDLCADRDDLLHLWRAHILRGHPYDGTAEFRALLWEIRSRPVRLPDGLLGAMGTFTVLEPERSTQAPQTQLWAAAGDHIGYAVESGDHFIRRRGRRGVTLVRQVADAVFEEYMRENPSRVHLIHDFPAVAPSLKVVR